MKKSQHLKPAKFPLEKNSVEAQKIRAKYNLALGVPFDSITNMAPNPVSLEKKHESLFLDKNYMVLEKTDGVRYCLFLGMYDNGQKFSVLVDRSFDIYEIEIIANKNFFEGLGTLVDGELVEEENYGVQGLMYLVFDVMCVSNSSVMNISYVERMEYAKILFLDYEDENTKYRFTMSVKDWDVYAENEALNGKIMTTGANMGALELRAKPFFHSKLVGTLIRKMENAKHKTDGVIIMPVSDPVRLKTHYGLFKWKKEHTVDFEFHVYQNETTNLEISQSNGWVWNIYYLSKDRQLTQQPVQVEGIFYSLKLMESKQKDSAQRKMIKSGQKNFQFIGECKIVVVETGMKAVDNCIEIYLSRLRPDKREANGDYTFSRTILNVKEAISANELCKIFKSI